MTTPNLNAPYGPGGEERSSDLDSHGGGGSKRSFNPRRSMRDLTPLIFLAMILIPSLIILCLAIADPGVAPPSPDAPRVITATPGS